MSCTGTWYLIFPRSTLFSIEEIVGIMGEFCSGGWLIWTCFLTDHGRSTWWTTALSINSHFAIEPYSSRVKCWHQLGWNFPIISCVDTSLAISYQIVSVHWFSPCLPILTVLSTLSYTFYLSDVDMFPFTICLGYQLPWASWYSSGFAAEYEIQSDVIVLCTF